VSGYFIVGLFGIKNKLNYGGVLRAAQCFGASSILIQSKRFEKYSTNTTKAERHIPTFLVDDLCEVTPYCISEFKHPKRAYYIFGPEDGSLGKNIIDKCQHVIKIPSNFCLNLAQSVNIVLYDRIMKEKLKNDR
jgi:tRNA(Leu) C34 or U34 (ribose-2'-O)-methylase TrmL